MDILEKDILDSISVIRGKLKDQMLNQRLGIYHLVLQILPWKLLKKILDY